MRYLLDTDTCIYLINRRPGWEEVLGHIDGLDYGDVLLSAVSLAELRFGVAKSVRGAANREKLERFLARFEAADFTDEDATAYGPLRATLEAQGTPIGPLDTLIAAQAVRLGAVLVTNNVREFGRISGLALEAWFRPERTA